MYIVHKQNQNNFENKQSTWTEEFIFNAKKVDYTDQWSSTNEITKLKIRRIIKNDKFIVFFEHINNLADIKEIRVTGLINNNKVDFLPAFDQEKNKFVFSYNSDLDSKNKLEFKDILNLNFEIEYKIGRYWNQTKHFTYWLKNNSKSKNILVSKETNIQVLSEISINSYSDWVDKNKVNHQFKTKYINLFFKPNLLKQGLLNQKLYDLEITKINKNDQEEYPLDNSDTYDLSLGQASIFSPFKEKYETKLKYKSFNRSEILVDSYSYYDRELDNVVVGQQNPYAKLGMLIPLKHSGIFGYQINLNIGKNLKDFKLSYAQDFPKAFFHLQNGLIKMKTKAIKGWLTNEKWHKIKYKNFAEIIKNADSLNFIEEMGNK
ncbi:MHO_1580 family protein [Metamycoplasma alkalescens]|uniref:Uncharacterized protein n=1 Tax=Metamycoplasma alkalescens TaxID=45363 RepID=A0A318U5D7_9BACT|nr:hypothetical protein [Metamycoplasma alkalescens]PYF43167.1 hypothetical protein BCF88_10434 [Metamycoplasma alkalescens]